MAHSITCDDFLHRYSDYRDGVVQGPERLRLEGHLAVCRQCQAYDARVARGVMVLQNSGEIEPSTELRRQLRDRIAAGRRRELPWFPVYAGVFTAFLLIAAVGVVMWDEQEIPIQTVLIDTAPPIVPVPAQGLTRPALLVGVDESLAVPAFGADWRAPGANEEPYIMKPAFTR